MDRPRKICLALAAVGVAALGMLAGSAGAWGDYKDGVVGGVWYTSGGWQSGATNELWNYDTGNIGDAKVSMYVNGIGLWIDNGAGQFLHQYDTAYICYWDCIKTASIVDKCYSSNTRTNAGCTLT